MNNRTCLVTGATSGIGRATVTALARQGARVIVGARTFEQGQRVALELQQHTGNTNVEVLAGDLASLTEVRHMAAECLERFPKLHVLINNAGVQMMERRLSVDQLEVTFQVNYLAPFLLTTLLRPALLSAAPSRVINVSSVVHRWAKLELNDLQSEHFETSRAYNRSKLALTSFTLELARQWHGTGITVNAFEPGLVATNFARGFTGAMALGNRVMNLFKKSPEQGADTAVYLASAPELEAVTGAYFANRRQRAPSGEAQNEDLARRLWVESLKLCGLEPR